MRFRPMLALLAVSCMAMSCMAVPAWAAEPDYSALDGARLVTLLADPAAAQHAHYELWRRAHAAQDHGWNAFCAEHYGQQVVLCPQGEGRPPLTLVLYGFLTRDTPAGDYPTAGLEALFPAEPTMPRPAGDEPAIDAYAADGRNVTPFGGDNVLGRRGALLDLDGDGRSERINVTSYGVEGVKNADVLLVWEVAERSAVVFAALINWETDDWRSEVVPAAAGQPGEIRLGPTDAAGKVQVRATVRRDATTRRWAFVGTPPAGHVRVLDPGDIWGGLTAQRADHLVFAADASAPQVRIARSSDDAADPAPVVVPPAPLYAFHTLGVAPDAVAAFMRPGRSIRDLEAARHLADSIPAAVWTLPPRAAALALVEANRSPAHRARFQLAIDDRDGQVPPEQLALDLSTDSSRCYFDIRAIWHLAVGPAGATLALARTERGGVVSDDPIDAQPQRDFITWTVDPALARQVAHIVWWLDRIRVRDRSMEDQTAGRSYSTADGAGLLLLVDGTGRNLLDRSGTLWSDSVPERWRGTYDHEVMLNLAQLLLTDGLVARLHPAPDPQRQVREGDLHATVAGLLVAWDARQVTASNALVRQAVRCAGQLVWADLDADLQRLAKEVTAALPSGGAQPPAEPEQGREGEQRAAQEPQALLAEIATARARLAAGQDVAALIAWASGERKDWTWALSRLWQLDHAAYVRVLETRLAACTADARRSDPQVAATARRLYAAIAGVDPERARALAAAVPAGEAGPLAVPAFNALQQADALGDPQQRVAALLAILLDSQQGWELRDQALRLLVPDGQPLRHSEPAIDAALVALLAQPHADGGASFMPARASRALARRGRVAQVDAVLAQLEQCPDSWVRSEILAAAVDLVQQAGPGPAHDRLARWVAANLERSDMLITEILWAAWALDLRESAPVLDRLATSTPEDYEGPMASSWGNTPRVVAEHRYHFARHLAQLWHETDPAAQAVLLLALAYDDPNAWNEPARNRRREAALTALRAAPGVHEAAAALCSAWSASGPFTRSSATAEAVVRAAGCVGATVSGDDFTPVLPGKPMH